MPTSLIDKVRAALKRSASTIPQLADAVADARRADADARAAVDKAQAAVTAGFMDAADKRQADRDALARTREAAEDAGLVLAEAERRHAGALAADAETARRAVYDGAKAQADAAAFALAKTYPTLARGMVAMLKELATAQQAVAAANADLPAGAAPIVDPELSARGAPGMPRQIVAEEDVELWSRVDMQTPVDAEYQRTIYSLDRNGSPSGWGRRRDDLEACFRLRRFRKTTFREPTNGDYPTPLAASIRLPAARGTGMAWGNPFVMHDPAISAAASGEAEPYNVLARIAELDAAAIAKPAKVERPVRVEFTLLGDVVPLPPEEIVRDTVHRPLAPAGSRFGASPFAKPGARAGARR